MSHMMYLPEIDVQVHENMATPLNVTVPKQPKKRTLKTSSTETRASKRFTVLTYNVWFGELYQKERLFKIIAMIREKAPDIVCLQELTVETFNVIENRLGPFYQIFQAFITEGNPYGSCIMCKKDTVKIVESGDNPYYYDYSHTKMHRRVVGCEIEFSKFIAPKMHILTTHLESLPENDTFRGHQVDVLQSVIKPLKNCIVAGDFSIVSQEEDAEKKLHASKLKDCWIEMGCPFKVKHTYNSKKNINIVDKMQQRYDRIMYHSSSNAVKPKLLSLIGRDNVSQSVPVPPSNHYGLLAEFEIHDDTA